MAKVYADYQAQLRRANAVDFDDLIGEVVGIFQRHPEVAEHYRRRFRHVLIDEYQDTNHAQYMLVSTLVGKPTDDPYAAPPSELCVVGDADQSIYAFRGATIRNIEEFERDYPQARTILLEQNYRSTQNILSAANAVIAQNEGRRDKRLWTALGDGEKLVGYVADNEQDEARFIAQEIDNLADDGASFSDIAVMYRTNNSSRALEDVFIRTGIPYKVAPVSTSARKSATLWPTCVYWITQTTVCRCGASLTPRAAVSGTARKPSLPCTPTPMA